MGKVIGTEPNIEIIHVRTYKPSYPDEEELIIDIGHIPIVFSAFKKSLQQISEVGPVDINWLETINIWRKKYISNEVGAFILPLWEIEKKSWETFYHGEEIKDNKTIEKLEEVADKKPSKLIMEYSFPKTDEKGRLTTIQISILSLNK